MADAKLSPFKQTLYPTRDSLDACLEELNSQLPITSTNELKAALAMYHNTMLHVIGQES